jgi:hypothetical protein
MLKGHILLTCQILNIDRKRAGVTGFFLLPTHPQIGAEKYDN